MSIFGFVMAVCNVLRWVALVSGSKKLVISLYSSLLSSFVYVIHIQVENEQLNCQVPLPLLLSETVGRFLLSLSDIRFLDRLKNVGCNGEDSPPHFISRGSFGGSRWTMIPHGSIVIWCHRSYWFGDRSAAGMLELVLSSCCLGVM